MPYSFMTSLSFERRILRSSDNKKEEKGGVRAVLVRLWWGNFAEDIYY